MKFRFTIARRLSFGFGILTFAVMLSSVWIYSTLSKNREISDTIIQVYTPSVAELNNLLVDLNSSKMLIKNWVHNALPDTKDKVKLKELHGEVFQHYKDTLTYLSKLWPEQETKDLLQIMASIEDSLFVQHKNIMEQLDDFESDSDLTITWMVIPMVDDNGEVIIMTDNILAELSDLLGRIEAFSRDSNRRMVDSFDSFQRVIVVIGTILFFVALVIAWLTILSIIKPINFLKQVLLRMSKGILPDDKMKVNNDEIGEMANALNSFIESLRKTSEFSQEIGKGNFKSEFTPLSEGDILGNSLINMRMNLQKAAEKEDNRKTEDEQRNWVTRGLAKFGDILRMHNDNMEQLSYSIISNLVKYLEANQGGMFILNDDNKEDIILELTAAYAYERKKFVHKQVRKGEGLVGTALLEKQTIHMTDIPDGYVNITSGLGKANPRSLLIVPLKLNEEVYGVIEIASFNPYANYQIEFVEKVGESIASTISNVKINSRTAALLRESKIQSEQLIQQEEEMRQNLEELQSTQEESSRRIKDLETSLEVFDNSFAIVEMDLAGKIRSVNDEFSKVLNLSYENFLGKQHQMLISIDHFDLVKYQEMLEDLGHGIKNVTQNVYVTPKGPVVLFESYVPFRDENGEIVGVKMVGFDITRIAAKADPTLA